MTHSPDLNTTGPFSKSYEDAKSVDFSAAIIMEMYNIIIPLTIENDIWSFLYPFEDEVWICFLLSVPIFIIAMGLAEYITDEEHSVPWATLIGFVLRNVLSENTGKLPDKRLYQKIMVYAWVWSCFVLVMAFAGNLTALITRPKLEMKYTRPDHFLNQSDMTLVTEYGTGLAAKLQNDPLKRALMNETEYLSLSANWTSNCFTNVTQYTGRHASICDMFSTQIVLSDDFKESGVCNWYTMEFTRAEPIAMAFQVPIW